MDTLTYEEITYDTIIADAKDQLEIMGITDNDISFEASIDLGARQLECSSLFVKRNCELEIHNGKACLPKGFNKLLGLRFCTDSGQSPFILTPGTLPPVNFPTTAFYSEAVYADLKYFNSCGCNCGGSQFNNWNQYQSTFEIIGNFIQFHQEPVYSKAVLAYRSMNKDCDGKMVIYENYERALVCWVCWRYLARPSMKKMYPNQWRDWATEFAAQKANLRGKEVVEHFRNTKKQIMEWANALVVDKNWEL